MNAIDQADRAASDNMADSQETMAESLVGDQVTFETTLAGAAATYQNAATQAAHDYRVAVAQAEHDLTVNVDQAAYAAAIAAAEAAETSATDAAVGGFESVVGPARTLLGASDANAALAAGLAENDAALGDVITGDAAVDTYDKAESADYDGEQKADAQAEHDDDVADADGRAAAIAAYAQSNPSPWADEAAAEAQAEAAQEDSDANAALTQADANADAQETQEQADADAAKAENDADTQARHDAEASELQAAHDQALTQAAVTDAVFASLPDVPVAGADGSTPTLTPDFMPGYEANDFYLEQTTGIPETTLSDVFDNWSLVGLQPVDYMPGDLGISGIAYDYEGYSGGGGMPFGLLGTFTPSTTPPDHFGLDSILDGGPVQVLEAAGQLPLRDLVRAPAPGETPGPLPSVFSTAMHFAGAAAFALMADKAGPASGGGEGAAPNAAAPAPNDGVPQHPDLQVDADGNIIGIGGKAVAPTSMEFLRQNHPQLWLAIQQGAIIHNHGTNRAAGPHGGVGGAVEGIYKIVQPGGGVKEITGPAASADKNAIRKRDEATMAQNEAAYSAVEGTLKTGKTAGDVADAILIVRGVGKFAIRKGGEYVLRRQAGKAAAGAGAEAAAGAAPKAAKAAADLAKAELEAQTWLTKLTGETAALGGKEGAHFLRKHSPMVTVAQLYERATTGLKVGSKLVKDHASRFFLMWT